MLVNGAVGLVWAAGRRVLRALAFFIKGGKIAEVKVIADPARLPDLDMLVLSD